MFTREKIAVLQSDTIVLYNRYGGFAKREKTESELKNLEKGKSGQYNGYMSKATSRKCKKFLSNWLTALKEGKKRFGRDCKFMPTFVTLTLPAKQKHTDKELKRNALDRFIVKMRNSYGVKHYFWRKENQVSTTDI